MSIRAVAFDIDGTLYPNWQMVLASIPSLLLAPRAIVAFGKVRREIRKLTYDRDFYSYQAQLLARRLHCTEERARLTLERRFYGVWKWSYGIIHPFPRVRETMVALRGAGLALGVLSDFPPERKLEYLGLADLPDTVLSAEETGYLKPHPVPFLNTARALGCNPEEILYVGNNYEYDIKGAREVGMKTAYLGRCSDSRRSADICFTSFTQLRREALALAQ